VAAVAQVVIAPQQEHLVAGEVLNQALRLPQELLIQLLLVPAVLQPLLVTILFLVRLPQLAVVMGVNIPKHQQNQVEQVVLVAAVVAITALVVAQQAQVPQIKVMQVALDLIQLIILAAAAVALLN
jgi:hypothetical protein